MMQRDDLVSIAAIRKSGRRVDTADLTAALLGRALARLSLWRERQAQRRALAALDEHLLRDIGKTRAEALAEARKPFWRP